MNNSNIRLRNLGTSNGNLTNATLVSGVDVELLFSYETLVGVMYGGHRYITSTQYSNTTSKHISTWLGERRKDAVKRGRAVEVEQEELERMVTFRVELSPPLSNGTIDLDKSAWDIAEQTLTPEQT